jgi:hypothetical protein
MIDVDATLASIPMKFLILIKSFYKGDFSYIRGHLRAKHPLFIKSEGPAGPVLEHDAKV